MSEQVKIDADVSNSNKELLLLKYCEELEESLAELSKIIKTSRVHRLQKHIK